jgi:hypothetical protein
LRNIDVSFMFYLLVTQCLIIKLIKERDTVEGLEMYELERKGLDREGMKGLFFV